LLASADCEAVAGEAEEGGGTEKNVSKNEEAAPVPLEDHPSAAGAIAADVVAFVLCSASKAVSSLEIRLDGEARGCVREEGVGIEDDVVSEESVGFDEKCTSRCTREEGPASRENGSRVPWRLCITEAQEQGEVAAE